MITKVAQGAPGGLVIILRQFALCGPLMCKLSLEGTLNVGVVVAQEEVDAQLFIEPCGVELARRVREGIVISALDLDVLREHLPGHGQIFEAVIVSRVKRGRRWQLSQDIAICLKERRRIAAEFAVAAARAKQHIAAKKVVLIQKGDMTSSVSGDGEDAKRSIATGDFVTWVEIHVGGSTGDVLKNIRLGLTCPYFGVGKRLQDMGVAPNMIGVPVCIEDASKDQLIVVQPL